MHVLSKKNLGGMGIHDEKVIFTNNIKEDLLSLGFTEKQAELPVWSNYGAGTCNLIHSNGKTYNYFHENTRKHTLIRIE